MVNAGAGRCADGEARVTVRGMASADVSRTVEVHLAAFHGFFLSSLGARFLTLFYGEAVRLGEIALVGEDGDELVGFVMGSTSPHAFYRALLRRSALRFAWAAAPAVLRRPAAALRVARALTMPRSARKPDGTATLMSLAVIPGAQGLGAGRALLSAFLSAARARGARRVDLTTDKLGNDRTNAFYLRAGFHVARDLVTREGRILHEYEIDLGPG